MNMDLTQAYKNNIQAYRLRIENLQEELNKTIIEAKEYEINMNKINIEILTLTKIGFDNMENHSPDYEEVVKTFVDTPEKTAYARLQEYFRSLPPEKLYVGYDFEIYPKYIIKRDTQYD